MIVIHVYWWSLFCTFPSFSSMKYCYPIYSKVISVLRQSRDANILKNFSRYIPTFIKTWPSLKHILIIFINLMSAPPCKRRQQFRCWRHFNKKCNRCTSCNSSTQSRCLRFCKENPQTGSRLQKRSNKKYHCKKQLFIFFSPFYICLLICNLS